jgi:hypothetical protein
MRARDGWKKETISYLRAYYKDEMHAGGAIRCQQRIEVFPSGTVPRGTPALIIITKKETDGPRCSLKPDLVFAYAQPGCAIVPTSWQQQQSTTPHTQIRSRGAHTQWRIYT